MVLAGGFTSAQTAIDDLWEWDGNQWHQATVAGDPQVGRFTAVGGFDSNRGRTIVYGGLTKLDLFAGATNEVWEWDGTGGHLMTPPMGGPGRRQSAALIWDPSRERPLLFGGFEGIVPRNDLWEWDADGSRRPAIQFTADTRIAVEDVTALRMRAWCGGIAPPFGANDAGATMQGWGQGRWQDLDSNTAEIGILTGVDALLDWTAPDLNTIADFILARDKIATVRCVSTNSSGVGAGEAEVAMQHVEVRVRYRTLP